MSILYTDTLIVDIIHVYILTNICNTSFTNLQSNNIMVSSDLLFSRMKKTMYYNWKLIERHIKILSINKKLPF